jgi:hypothetical protein
MVKNDSQPTISLGNEPAVLDLVANSIMGLWDVVNNLTRLRPSQRERYRVTVFGSARVPEDHWVYAAVRDVAEQLTPNGMRHHHRRWTGTNGSSQ